ncbi:MAG TPA: hypothetical protein VHU41_17690 [Thermoanaerobaculia bacterium]|nr:hypothetical protein [Thermoanaerobaculia bacterium]
MHRIAASPLYERAIAAVADLLTRQRLDYVFAGNVARAAHIGTPVDEGSIDVIATMGPQQMNQVATMASHRGFRVEREEVEATEELDLIPMHFEDVRVHVLVASNALYGRMVAEGVVASGQWPVAGEESGHRPPATGHSIRVPRLEDFALLLQMSNDVTSLMTLIEAPEFDRGAYNRKLTSIGLRELVVPE